VVGRLNEPRQCAQRCRGFAYGAALLPVSGELLALPGERAGTPEPSINPSELRYQQPIPPQAPRAGLPLNLEQPLPVVGQTHCAPKRGGKPKFR
jgi:hypothetical protein